MDGGICLTLQYRTVSMAHYTLDCPLICDMIVPCYQCGDSFSLISKRRTQAWAGRQSTAQLAACICSRLQGPVQSCGLHSFVSPVCKATPCHTQSQLNRPPPSTGHAAAHAPLHMACAPQPRWRIKVLTSPTTYLPPYWYRRIAHRTQHLNLAPFTPTIALKVFQLHQSHS